MNNGSFHLRKEEKFKPKENGRKEIEVGTEANEIDNKNSSDKYLTT
jgi:hypothetical protein